MANHKFRLAVLAPLGLCLAVAPAAAQAPATPAPVTPAPAYAAPTRAPPGQAQAVRLPQGALTGAVSDGAGWFLGIPYAPAPVGDRRWRPPGPPPGWTGSRDATRAGAPCAEQEDCLFLNVLRPAAARPGQRLPVMVWIHGGSFVAGTSLGGYGGDTDGHEFAREGVIVVSVNYRLGRAGYFAHPAISREGHLHSNYGALDQIAALKWVKANIAQFGGDPGNVTIFGESAGGLGVLLLMVSPEARGLFNKVIAESSFARSQTIPLAEAEASGVRLAEAAGVRGDDAAAAAALRALPLSALPLPPRGTREGRTYPIQDGRIFPTNVMTAFEGGQEAKVPLIIGGNSNEASLTRPTPAALDAMPVEKRDAILKVFDPTGTADRGQVINDFTTIQGVTEPDRAIVRLHSRNGAPAWTYYFSDVPAGQRARRAYGAAHTEELPFVFVSPTGVFAPSDLALAKAVNAYWAAFAKTGDPASAGGAAWPRWTAETEGQIEFASDGPQTRTHFLKAQRDLAESYARR
ncbi:carboxylesterase/lipase family protein [Phenylobacterium sp.]|uniref:carboxylesterase/lipase family protein n=1 Tax=Phenylobacterium sp. TaxID=1871053 RepID=UPI003561CA0B